MDEGLDSAIKAIEASFGKGSIQRLSDSKAQVENVGVISTGSIALDTALGVGEDMIIIFCIFSFITFFFRTTHIYDDEML